MAIEGANIFVAGGLFVGLDGALSVLGSRGLREASFTRVSAGVYTVELVDPVAVPALVPLANAIALDNAPLIAHASAFVAAGVGTISIRTTTHAGAPADAANINLAVLRPATDG